MSSATRTEADRRSAVREWRRSGLDAATFASALGVSVHTLYAWSCRFSAGLPRRVTGRATRLVELVPTATAAPERGGGGVGPRFLSPSGAGLELELRCGRTLRFPADVDDAALRRVIAASESA